MIDGWNEKYIERLQELGVSYLYISLIKITFTLFLKNEGCYHGKNYVRMVLLYPALVVME